MRKRKTQVAALRAGLVASGRLEALRQALHAGEIQAWGFGEHLVSAPFRRQDLVLWVVHRRHGLRFEHHDGPLQIAAEPRLANGDTPGQRFGRARLLTQPVTAGGTVRTLCGNGGSIGYVVHRPGQPNGTRFLLSNNHVLARGSQLSPSDAVGLRAPYTMSGPACPLTVRPGDAVVVPATGYAYSFLDDRVATVSDWVPLQLTPQVPLAQQDNRVDAAIAELHPGVTALAGVGPAAEPITSWRAVEDLDFGGPVRMHGGESHGYSQGTLHAQVDIQVGFMDGEAVMKEQLVTSVLGVPGDSGSLVYTPDGAAIGLLYATTGTFSLVSPIQPIQEALNIRVSDTRWSAP